MTNEQLVLLCLIRSGRRRIRPLARGWQRSISTTHRHVDILAGKRLVARCPGQAGTLTLTEKGRRAVRDIALIPNGGGYTVGRVQLYDNHVSGVNSNRQSRSGA